MLLNMNKITEYILQAAAIALVSRYFLGRTPLDRGLFILIISIAVSHLVVDLFAPDVGIYMRQGVGFGIGHELVGQQQGGSMGLQTALGTQRTIKQTGGGLQSALGTQRTLRNEAAQVNIIERFMSDRETLDLDYYEKDRSSPGRAGEIHEQFIDNLMMDKVIQVMAYDGKDNSAKISFDASVTHRQSLNDFLYSEDLISIGSGESRLVLLDGNYIQVVPKTQSGLNDKLFKLRFKAVNSESSDRTVIKYGDPVLIQYSDDAAQTKMLNHDGNLNILQNNRDVVFRLLCKNPRDPRDVVDTKDQILIGCAEGSYLKIDRDRVTTTANEYEATVFDISSVHGYNV
jgi:hypothetical protein